jgi:hypothetical protein
LCSFFQCLLDDIFEVDNTLQVKYPSPFIEQSIKNIPVPESLVITSVIDKKTLKEETISYVRPNNNNNKHFSNETMNLVKQLTNKPLN